MNDPRPTEPAAPPPPASPWGGGPAQLDYMVDAPEPATIAAGDVIRRALGVLGDNFFAFFAITVICYVPGVVWSAYLAALTVGALDGAAPPMVVMMVPVVGVALCWLLSSFVAQAVMVGRTVEAMAQRERSLGAVFMLGIRRVPQAIAVSLLAALAPMVILGGALAALIALKMTSLALAVLLVAGGIVGAGAVACALYVAVPAVVVERVSVVAALQRSWELTRGARIVIFAALFVTGVAQAVLSSLAKAAVPWALGDAAVEVLMSLLTSAFGAALGAVTYVRLRETAEQVHASKLVDGLALER